MTPTYPRTRILGVVRLSVLTDESTSPERQREHLDGYARSRGGELIAVAEDLDVSGAVSPFERPKLGPWLTDERAHLYDTIAAVKIDRLSRSLRDFVALLDWAHERGKSVVAVTEGVDTSTPTGKMVAQLLGIFAEFEREQIRARVADSVRLAEREGRYHGGPYPDGYVPVQTAEGWFLAHDPERVELIRHIVDRVIGGESLTSIAADLDARGVPSPANYRRHRAGRPATARGWTGSSLASMLRSRALLGEVTRVEKDDAGRRVERVVRGADGLPILRGDPILSLQRFTELQARLDANSVKPTRSRRVSPYNGILFCGVCYDAGRGEVPYYPVAPDGRKRSMRYRCRSETAKVNGERRWCGNSSVLAELVDRTINRIIMDELGDEPIVERRFVPGEDHSEELARVNRAIADLRSDRDAGLYVGEADERDYRARMAALIARRTELEKLPNRPARWEDVDTGERFWQRWPAIAVGPADERRRFLIASGYRWYVQGTVRRGSVTGLIMTYRRVPPGGMVTTTGGIVLAPEGSAEPSGP